MAVKVKEFAAAGERKESFNLAAAAFKAASEKELAPFKKQHEDDVKRFEK